MALSLHKTSRFARLYQDRVFSVPGDGVMKASIEPMHYETVAGSGVFDISIDLTWDAVDTSTIDGYEMTRASYQWELQTDVLAMSQQPQGTVTYRDRDGVNEFIMRAIQFSYYHIPTVAFDTVGTAFDYSTGAAAAEATKIQRTRNLGSHAGVPNETIGVAGAMRWNTLDTVDAQTVWAEFSTQQEQCEIGVTQHDDSAVFIYANEPPLTTESETQFGVLYEVDFSGIPAVELADGTVVNPATDDFNDLLGDILLKDASGNLIGRLAQTAVQNQYANHFSGFPRTTKYFWEDGGTNYMHIGISVFDFADGGAIGYLYKTIIAAAFEGTEPLSANDGAGGDYWNGGYGMDSYGDVTTYNVYNGTGRYFGVGEQYTFHGIHRFHHELPGGASLVDGSEYADLIAYDFYYPETGRYNGDRGTYNAAVEIDTFIDVGGPNQGYLVDGDVNNYGSWRNSISFTRSTGDFPVANGIAHAAIDIASPMEEFLSLGRVHSGLTVRMDTRGNELNAGYDYAMFDANNNVFGKGAILNVEFTYPPSNKPGFRDGGGERNTRESRFYSSSVPYRLGVNDEPHVQTADNKNRSRFS